MVNYLLINEVTGERKIETLGIFGSTADRAKAVALSSSASARHFNPGKPRISLGQDKQVAVWTPVPPRPEPFLAADKG